MSYYLDDSKVGLGDLLDRIKATDLIPSRLALLDNIEARFEKLKKSGCAHLADLRKGLKNAKSITELAAKSGVDTQYLTLLKREIEGYFPKPVPLKSFDWLQKSELVKLESAGLKNTVLLYEALNSPKKRADISHTLGIDIDVINALFNAADLTRIQWVSPMFARMLTAAGCENPKKVSKADAEALAKALAAVNSGNKYYKGNVGLRDIKRLIQAASYVS